MDSERKKLLVADDDPMILVMLQKTLEREFDIVAVPDGLAAEHEMSVSRFDGILADNMMPGLEGIEVLRRAQLSQPDAVRILITAGDRATTVPNAVNIAKVHRFLSKPLRLHELVGIVTEALHLKELEDENSLLVETLKIRNTELERVLEVVRARELELEQRVDERTAELQIALADLEKVALRDGLTGLYNHRCFQDMLGRELQRAARYGWSVGLVFLDVDHFKHYNDRLGHPRGDALLREIARVLGNTGDETDLAYRGRASDVVARYGGEEFVLVLPQTDLAGAAIRAERLREMLAARPFPGVSEQPLGHLSASFGVAVFPGEATTADGLIELADQRAMLAKRSGRDRVVTEGGSTTPAGSTVG